MLPPPQKYCNFNKLDGVCDPQTSLSEIRKAKKQRSLPASSKPGKEKQRGLVLRHAANNVPPKSGYLKGGHRKGVHPKGGHSWAHLFLSAFSATEAPALKKNCVTCASPKKTDQGKERARDIEFRKSKPAKASFMCPAFFVLKAGRKVIFEKRLAVVIVPCILHCRMQYCLTKGVVHCRSR